VRVLIAEDHRRLATALADGLRREGIAVDLAFDGLDALAHVAVNRYDVVVLDRDLPRLHGDQVCRRLAAEGNESRVLMLTASSTIRDRVAGLGLGAEDGHALVSVANSGPAIPPEEIERLFEPFQRLDLTRGAEANGHHGLGLSIVRAIATAHGAALIARPRPAGGLEVSVRF
jgi:CheY-like chemotaxis protein